MLRAGLNGRNYSPPQEPGDLPETSLNTCHVQKLSEDYKKASQGSLPASLIASPNAEKLDGVQKGVEFGLRMAQLVYYGSRGELRLLFGCESFLLHDNAKSSSERSGYNPDRLGGAEGSTL
ncbi:hypothetical protein JTE90_002917 [Oedothorax gibbosus]|uniref:Uncharacterized protein n=1 Tax=Oedothorax gibbosus TaxID=931172 RepID=A0AAV6TLT0_9ARAC|nr:hypothetical protein JTE90_002917 [Oedothorax gibbosus]